MPRIIRARTLKARQDPRIQPRAGERPEIHFQGGRGSAYPAQAAVSVEAFWKMGHGLASKLTA
jgi:hypothetical protein